MFIYTARIGVKPPFTPNPKSRLPYVSWERTHILLITRQALPLDYRSRLHTPVSKMASTKVRIQRTQFSKLYGVICAASRTRKAKLSQHLTNANGSCAYNSFSTVRKNSFVSTGLVEKGWISPSRPTRIQLLPVLGDNSGEVLTTPEDLATSSESEVYPRSFPRPLSSSQHWWVELDVTSPSDLAPEMWGKWKS